MKNIITILLLLVTNFLIAQPNQQFAKIGDLTTVGGDVIKDCKVGYRTVGKLNADKSNVVLWPTWFTGTSEQVIGYGFTNSLIDTSGLYIIIVDALTNGVSSSPSNTPEFPTISIRDMVNSQYSLLVNHLNIDHLYAVMGYSMGGMQTFEWVVAYPEFMDKAIPIAATPKFSSHGILIFQTMIDLMEEAGRDKQKLDFAYKQAHNIFLMNINTPALMTNSLSPDSLENYLNDEYARLMKPEDYLGGLNAFIPHDIYKSANSNPEDIKNVIQADMLVISGTQDHAVNPIASIELSKTLDCQLVTLLSDCGHGAIVCEAEKVKKATSSFLQVPKGTTQIGKYADVNGVKIYYETYGEGEPLLLLHGFSLSHKFWNPWIENLQKGHKLIIPDLRGHGNSTNPTNTFTHKLSAKDMYGLMDALKIEKFKAMGHSSGGMTLTHMATMDTSRIMSMILIGATSFFPEQCRAIQRGVYYDTENEDWIAHLKTIHPGGEKQVRQILTQFRNMSKSYDDMNFTSPYLATIKCQTLIIHGDRDNFFPVDIPVDSYKSIPDSYLWIVPNDGHIPLGLMGNPSIWSEMFIKVADDFFKGNWK